MLTKNDKMELKPGWYPTLKATDTSRTRIHSSSSLAEVAELADAQCSERCSRKGVWVQLPPPALFQ